MEDEIPLLDLDGQHRPLRDELEAAAHRVLASNRFVLGPEVACFEREAAAALKVARAVGVSSGSGALEVMMIAAGVTAGDEVITTPFTFFATAGAIARIGARPRFADIDAATLNLDAEAAADAIGVRTRAALVVHLFGRVARTKPLERACAARGLPLLEDAAQAIGACATDSGPPRAVGTIGRAAALSFFPSKNLGGFGDGGLVITNDDALADRVIRLRSHGAVGRFQHAELGGNFRLDELQAALLRVKLPHVGRWTARRRALAARYAEGLAALPVRLPPPDQGCVWNQFVIRVPGGLRDALAGHLARAGVATAVYYPTPLHLQPVFASLGYRAGAFPQAELAAGEVLALPIYPGLTDGAVDRVALAARGFFASPGARRSA